MAQKVTGIIKLQINAAKATASPPVGPALGQHGVNIAAFIKEFNARTKDMEGYKIPVVITVYADRSFTFITKTPPTPLLVSVTGVNTQLDVQLDGLVELSGSTLDNQVQGFVGIILNRAVNQLGALLILFASKQCNILLYSGDAEKSSHISGFKLSRTSK